MSRTNYTTAATIRRGKFQLLNPALWIDAMREFKDGPVLASVTTPTRVRSLEQNRLYWVGFIKPLSDYTGYEPYLMHRYLVDRYLTKERIVIADAQGEVVDERTIARPTTTTLSPAAFSAYLDDIGAFAAELGVVVGR